MPFALVAEPCWVSNTRLAIEGTRSASTSVAARFALSLAASRATSSRVAGRAESSSVADHATSSWVAAHFATSLATGQATSSSAAVRSVVAASSIECSGLATERQDASLVDSCEVPQATRLVAWCSGP